VHDVPNDDYHEGYLIHLSTAEYLIYRSKAALSQGSSSGINFFRILAPIYRMHSFYCESVRRANENKKGAQVRVFPDSLF